MEDFKWDWILLCWHQRQDLIKRPTSLGRPGHTNLEDKSLQEARAPRWERPWRARNSWWCRVAGTGGQGEPDSDHFFFIYKLLFCILCCKYSILFFTLVVISHSLIIVGYYQALIIVGYYQALIIFEYYQALIIDGYYQALIIDGYYQALIIDRYLKAW